MSTESVVEILQGCRDKLQDLSSVPFDVERYREDISNECDVGTDLLDELREAQKSETELEAELLAKKDLPNKMQYSNVVKRVAVTKKKVAELSSEINHLIRNHDVVTTNKKRAKIELDRLDEILRVAQSELEEYDDTPSLRDETEGFVPLQVARDHALAKMKETLHSLEEVRESLQKEKAEHREIVYEENVCLRRIRADLQAMENGTYAPAVEFETALLEKRATQTREFDDKRRAMEDEIAQLQTSISNDALVHDANVSAFEAEKADLEGRLAEMTKSNASAMVEAESTLEKLKAEQAENLGVLERLEKRLATEQEEAKLLEEEEAKRTRAAEEKRAMEEREHFAALWIQLRWKAYLKRKAAKGSGKGKKGKKGKNAKKKK